MIRFSLDRSDEVLQNKTFLDTASIDAVSFFVKQDRVPCTWTILMLKMYVLFGNNADFYILFKQTIFIFRQYHAAESCVFCRRML